MNVRLWESSQVNIFGCSFGIRLLPQARFIRFVCLLLTFRPLNTRANHHLCLFGKLGRQPTLTLYMKHQQMPLPATDRLLPGWLDPTGWCGWLCISAKKRRESHIFYAYSLVRVVLLMESYARTKHTIPTMLDSAMKMPWRLWDNVCGGRAAYENLMNVEKTTMSTTNDAKTITPDWVVFPSGKLVKYVLCVSYKFIGVMFCCCTRKHN